MVRWFHDGRRLVAAAACDWVPLATAIDLRAGHASDVSVDVPTTPLSPGAYTGYLLLTEVGRYRVVSEVETSLGLVAEPP